MCSDLPTSAVEQLTLVLRQRILSGEFLPGTFLRDVKMCEEHQTSRHTFRAAAQILAMQGLLRQIPNRGFMLPRFGPDDVIDITRLRSAIEGEAVRMIVLTGIIPTAAHDALETMVAGGDRSTLVTADRDFHRAIVLSAGSSRLARVYAGLEGEIELLLVQRQGLYSTPAEMAKEHRALLDSLRSRHLPTARTAFEEHWNDLQLKLLE